MAAVQDGNDIVVTAELKIPAKDSTATVRYRFTGSGQLAIDSDFRPGQGLPDLPRVGFQCAIPNRTPACKWYGRGPHENYIDRNSGAWTTIHDALVPMMFFRYVDPQESGNRTAVRWATLTSPMGGSGLRVDATGEHLLEMGIYPCAAADITLAMHPTELPPRDFYTLNLDHRQAGLGGINSWGARALPRYQIQSDRPYHWSFLLSLADTPAPPTVRPPMPPRKIPPLPEK